MSCSLVKFIKLSKKLAAFILKVARSQWWHPIISWRPQQREEEEEEEEEKEEEEDDDDDDKEDADDDDEGHKNDDLTKSWS